MRLDEITLEPSATVPGAYILRITSAGRRVTFSFDNNLLHFAEAVSEAVKFFGLAQGLLESDGKGGLRSKVKH